MSRRATAILVLAAALHVVLAALPESMGDVFDYRQWTRALARGGLVEAYWPAPADPAEYNRAVDYPPLLPYLLWGLGRGLGAVSSAALQSDWWLDRLIRLLMSAASLLTAVLIYREARRVSPGEAELSLGLVALNPALAFDTAYWGQADALWVMLLVVALLGLARGRPAWGWAATTGAVLTKPLAVPFAPLIALETLKRVGIRRTLNCLAVAIGTTALVLLPFLWEGRFEGAIQVLVSQLDIMPFVSVNAHNLWWIVGRGTPWTESAVRPLGFLSYRSLSLLLFGAFYLVTLARLWVSRGDHALYVAAAAIAIGFFMLSTHMHENHLVGAIPLLALAGLCAPFGRLFLLVTTVTAFANMLLHDPGLTHLLRPLTPGPHLRLPQQLAFDARVGEYLVAHGYPWVAELMRGETSLVGALATLVNAQVNVLLFAAFVFAAYSGPSFDDALRGPSLLPARRLWAACMIALVAASGAPFVWRVLRYPTEHFFLLNFHEATVRTEVTEGVAIRSFEIGGDSRMVLYVHPPSEVGYNLTPRPGELLSFGVGLDPGTWSPQKGDGVTFEIRAEADGASSTLFSRYIDPKREPADRRWHDVHVDLSAYAGRPITLVFATTGGPRGNIDFDWAGFSDPTLAIR